MRPRPGLFTAATALLVAGVGFCRWGFTASTRAETVFRRAERALAQTRQRAEQLEAAAQAEPPPLANAMSRARSTASENAPIRTARPGTTATDVAREPETTGTLPPPEVNDPGRVEALAQYRARLGETWGLLIATLQLTPAQTDRFKDLLTWRQNTELSLEAKALAEGLTEDSPAIQALDEQYSRAFKNEVRALLGREGYAKYRDYFPARHVGPMLTDVAATLANADAPMDNGTALALLYVLADASEKKPSGTAIGDTIDWNKALPAAKPLLSPAQHTLLQAFATHRSTERLIDEQVRRLGRRPK